MKLALKRACIIVAALLGLVVIGMRVSACVRVAKFYHDSHQTIEELTKSL